MEPKKQNRFVNSLSLPLKFVGLLWVIHLVQWILHLNLGFLGVFPRDLAGLRGILFSPLLHGDFGHIISNTPPLLVLSTLIMFFYRKVAIPSFLMIYFLTGVAVWIFGRPVFHIGASGVIYGLVAFVFWNGIFRFNVKSIALALIVAFYYGSMFMGILPGQEGISWESHLLGGLVGIFVSFWFKNQIEQDEVKPKYSWELDENNQKESFFLDRDVFEKTKEERYREQRDQLW